MILLYTDASPFARKCRVLISELGAQEDIDLRDIGMISPLETNDVAGAQGPLGKIPLLMRPGASALYDSGVICDYLNDTRQGNFFPDAGEEKWRALRVQALADGLTEAAVAIRYDILFRGNAPEDDAWHERQADRMGAALDALNVEVVDFTAEPTIGEVSTACALGYLDLRFGDLDWRDDRGALADWFSAFAERPSMVATAPKT